MVINNWPLVDEYDDGIRPAGRPNECFYCGRRVGQSHRRECVIVKKTVELRVTARLGEGEKATALWQIDEPHSWDGTKIVKRYNKSSWCKSNFLGVHLRDGRNRGPVTWEGRDAWGELEKLYRSGDCLCTRLRFEFVRVVDPTPRRELHVPSHLPPGLA